MLKLSTTHIPVRWTPHSCVEENHATKFQFILPYASHLGFTLCYSNDIGFRSMALSHRES